jgi:hypothetical protein
LELLLEGLPLQSLVHNFKHHPPKLRLNPTEKDDEYSMRAVLLKAPNVFSLDFANQEDRMSAWFANEEKDIQHLMRIGNCTKRWVML